MQNFTEFRRLIESLITTEPYHIPLMSFPTDARVHDLPPIIATLMAGAGQARGFIPWRHSKKTHYGKHLQKF